MKESVKIFFEFLGFLFVAYLMIGFLSVLGVMDETGYNYGYMPFWHAPWRWFVSLL